MADLVTVAANVGFKSLGVPGIAAVVFGEQVDPGEVVYRSTDNKYYKAQATTAVTSGGTSGALGIALTYSAAGDAYGVIATNGSDVYLGVNATKGVTYVVSDAAAGGVAPLADLLSGDFVTQIGVGNDDNTIRLNFNATGRAL